MVVPKLRADSRAISRLCCGVKGEGTGPKLRTLTSCVGLDRSSGFLEEAAPTEDGSPF